MQTGPDALRSRPSLQTVFAHRLVPRHERPEHGSLHAVRGPGIRREFALPRLPQHPIDPLSTIGVRTWTEDVTRQWTSAAVARELIEHLHQSQQALLRRLLEEARVILTNRVRYVTCKLHTAPRARQQFLHLSELDEPIGQALRARIVSIVAVLRPHGEALPVQATPSHQRFVLLRTPACVSGGRVAPQPC